MSYEHVLIEAKDGVGIVTLNRPDKLNAMNRQLSGELQAKMPVCFAVGRTECRLRVHCGGLGRGQ